jgi:hypothetical protein
LKHIESLFCIEIGIEPAGIIDFYDFDFDSMVRHRSSLSGDSPFTGEHQSGTEAGPLISSSARSVSTTERTEVLS